MIRSGSKHDDSFGVSLVLSLSYQRIARSPCFYCRVRSCGSSTCDSHDRPTWSSRRGSAEGHRWLIAISPAQRYLSKQHTILVVRVLRPRRARPMARNIVWRIFLPRPCFSAVSRKLSLLLHLISQPSRTLVEEHVADPRSDTEELRTQRNKLRQVVLQVPEGPTLGEARLQHYEECLVDPRVLQSKVCLL